MPVRDEVRRTQRTLAALDAAHTRATTRLDVNGQLVVLAGGQEKVLAPWLS